MNSVWPYMVDRSLTDRDDYLYILLTATAIASPKLTHRPGASTPLRSSNAAHNMRPRTLALAPLDGTDFTTCISITNNIPCCHTPRFLSECWSPRSTIAMEKAHNDLEEDWDDLDYEQKLERADLVLKGRLCLYCEEHGRKLRGRYLARRYADDEAGQGRRRGRWGCGGRRGKRSEGCGNAILAGGSLETQDIRTAKALSEDVPEPISVPTMEVGDTCMAVFGPLSPVDALALHMAGLTLVEKPWITDCCGMDLN